MAKELTLSERLRAAWAFDENAADKNGKLQSKTSASSSFSDELNYATGFLHGVRDEHSRTQGLREAVEECVAPLEYFTNCALANIPPLPSQIEKAFQALQKLEQAVRECEK